ncbi:hypothetical protein ACRALDRAFT_1091866 [Sodiomyces alcalophilus JCM 7366]|uniref:uncharacterized protein n=1 Tax=Sodiomyces alcalophilus JCM 7366 TaxID=591952 RepID=UPI0039B4E2A7
MPKDNQIFIMDALINVANFGAWFEGDVLGLPKQLRYFHEGGLKGLVDVIHLIIITFLMIVVFPIAEAMDGFPWSWRRSAKQAAFVLIFFWAWMLLWNWIIDTLDQYFNSLRCSDWALGADSGHIAQSIQQLIKGPLIDPSQDCVSRSSQQPIANC